MRVLFLQQQPCIRALKYAVGLRATGTRVRLGFAYRGKSLGEWYGTGDDLFDAQWSLSSSDSTRELIRVIDEFDPDVIHSHNLPDSLTVMALDICDGRPPVIHDVHDLQSLRQTPYEDGFPEPEHPLLLERRAIECSAAVITVSDELFDALKARYKLPEHTRVFPNYASRRDLPVELPPPERRRSGAWRVVYEGTLSTNGGHYDLRSLFVSIVEAGVVLDIYPSRPAPDYHDLAEEHPTMRCLDTLDPPSLLRALPHYDYGWAGFNAAMNRAHLDTALPNKLYEYLGCGLPVLTLRHKALARVVETRGVGISLARLEDLGRRLAEVELSALRRRVAEERAHLTVEANVARIVDLYESVAR
jgi:glycosyltransferase involved in cell wall biosynthesis